MTQKPKITIVIPVYNVEKYIESCLRSVFSQTYSGEMECILVDDCTPDRSIVIARDVLNSYSGRIGFNILHHESNKGLSAARNTGIENASGDYVFFLDSDDEITPDCIDELASMAERYPGTDFVQGCAEEMETRKNISCSLDISEYVDGTEAAKMVYHVDVYAWNKLLSTAFIKRHQLSFMPGLLHEDVLWLFDMSKCVSAFAVSRKVTYRYRTDNAGSVMKSGDVTKRACSIIKMYEMMSLNLDADRWRDECMYLDYNCKFTYYLRHNHYTIDTKTVFIKALESWFKVIRHCDRSWPKLYGLTFLPFRRFYSTMSGYMIYCKYNDMLVRALRH